MRGEPCGGQGSEQNPTVIASNWWVIKLGSSSLVFHPAESKAVRAAPTEA